MVGQHDVRLAGWLGTMLGAAGRIDYLNFASRNGHGIHPVSERKDTALNRAARDRLGMR
jgi:hypothetical protein